MLKPLNGYAVIRKIGAERKTGAGILLPETGDGQQNKAIIGEIVAIGDESKLRVGNKISFRQSTVIKIEDGQGKGYEIIKEEHIFGIWENED